MRRLRALAREPERGATAVLVAVILVALIGFGALSVDMGSIWSARKQLQNGADAGALAIAQACAHSTASGECAIPNPSAAKFAKSNKFDAKAEGTAVVNFGAQEVTATTSSDEHLWLAGVLGNDIVSLEAEATARWLGSPSKLTTVPLTVSTCQFLWQNGFPSGMPTPGTPVTINLKSNKKQPGETSVYGPCVDNAAHNEEPGGFGFLYDTNNKCSAEATVGAVLVGYGGNTQKNPACTADRLRELLGTSPGMIVNVPLFDASEKSGGDMLYTISGFAALEVSGYCLPAASGKIVLPSTEKCAGSFFIRGTFVGSSTLEDTNGGGPNYGINIVRLVK